MFGLWLIYAFAFLFFWGLVNVLDSYFIESEIYDNVWDGIIVSSLFKVFGILIIGGIFFSQLFQISLLAAVLSMLVGAFMSLAYLFAFLAILHHNDTPLLQVVWNLSSPLVVVLALIFLGEVFSLKTYAGMLIVFLGSFVIYFQKGSFGGKLKKFVLFSIPMVVLYSVSEVFLKYVEEGLGASFGQSFTFLCLGQVVFGTIILLSRRNAKHVFQLVKKNFSLFFFGEVIELLGLFFMVLAVIKSPAVSLVAVAESFMPVAIILLTFGMIPVLKIFKRGKLIKKIYDEKMITGLPVKIIATLMMAIGAYLI